MHGDWPFLLALGFFWTLGLHATIVRTSFYRGRPLWSDPFGDIAEHWDTFSILGKTAGSSSSWPP